MSIVNLHSTNTKDVLISEKISVAFSCFILEKKIQFLYKIIIMYCRILIQLNIVKYGTWPSLVSVV